jgi:hypothetical protein
VVLDGPLVGEPQQRARLLGQRVVHLPLRRLRPRPDRRDPVGGVRGQVLLHERPLPEPGPHHRQRPPGQLGEDPVGDGVEVVDEVALGGAGPVEQLLVEVGQLDPVPHLVGPALPRHGRRSTTPGCRKATFTQRACVKVAFLQRGRGQGRWWWRSPRSARPGRRRRHPRERRLPAAGRSGSRG